MFVPRYDCTHMIGTIHRCGQICLSPDALLPRHDCAHTIVPIHDCVQTH